MPFPLIDLHEDLLLHINHPELFPHRGQTSFEQLAAAGAKIVVATAFPTPPDENYFDPATNGMIEDDFRAYRAWTDEHPEWVIIRDAADLDRVLATRGLIGLILHVEGLNVVGDEDWDRLERWYELGWRSLGLVWILTNPLGGGTKDPTTSLTSLGEKMIRWLEDHRMVVDFAHMNAPTFDAASRLVRRPILISHGNSHALCPHPRNYTDEQLRLVGDRGGAAGVFFAKRYVTGESPAEVRDVVNHIDRFREVMGIEHVALGTDFGGILSGLVEGLPSVDSIAPLWDELAARGYNQDDIEAIAYRNAARVLRELLS